MLYLKQISYFSKAVYQVICLALQNTVFIKISYQDHQGYIIRQYEISSGTFNDVTEQLREPLAVKVLRHTAQWERETERIKSTLNNSDKVMGSHFATWH